MSFKKDFQFPPIYGSLSVSCGIIHYRLQLIKDVGKIEYGFRVDQSGPFSIVQSGQLDRYEEMTCWYCILLLPVL